MNQKNKTKLPIKDCIKLLKLGHFNEYMIYENNIQEYQCYQG